MPNGQLVSSMRMIYFLKINFILTLNYIPNGHTIEIKLTNVIYVIVFKLLQLKTNSACMFAFHQAMWMCRVHVERMTNVHANWLWRKVLNPFNLIAFHERHFSRISLICICISWYCGLWKQAREIRANPWWPLSNVHLIRIRKYANVPADMLDLELISDQIYR